VESNAWSIREQNNSERCAVSRKSKQQSKSPGNRPAVGDERAAQRVAKAEASIRRRKRAALGRKLGIGGAVIAVVAAAYTLLPESATYSAGGSGQFIEGVQVYSNGAGHVSGPLIYPQTPPAGGQHNPTWLNCGIYTEPVPNEYAVHSMEHGAVWVTNDPALNEAELEMLRQQLPSTYLVLSPYAGLPTPIVLSAWNVQLPVEIASDERVPLFLEEYWRNQNVPEPGALCAGGLSGPGRVS
jgi:hypothetical protein